MRCAVQLVIVVLCVNLSCGVLAGCALRALVCSFDAKGRMSQQSDHRCTGVTPKANATLESALVASDCVVLCVVPGEQQQHAAEGSTP